MTVTVDVATPNELPTCLELRNIVFVQEQGVSVEEEVDGLDNSAIHLLARNHGDPQGAARILIKGDTAKIGRVCVLKQARGTGMGAALIRKAVEVARATDGVRQAKLGAQVHALSFYEKLGFQAFGPVYMDAGIEHQDMQMDLG